MGIKANCYLCNNGIIGQAALLVSPPIKINKEMSVSTNHKYHICTGCWQTLLKFIDKHIEDARETKKHKR